MLPFTFSDCLVCEEVRLEARNLTTLLGFYGITPHVEIMVQDLGMPVKRLTFMLISHDVSQGQYECHPMIVSPQGEPLLTLPEQTLYVEQNVKNWNLIIAVEMLLFSMPGVYSFQILTGKEIAFKTSFSIATATTLLPEQPNPS